MKKLFYHRRFNLRNSNANQHNYAACVAVEYVVFLIGWLIAVFAIPCIQASRVVGEIPTFNSHWFVCAPLVNIDGSILVPRHAAKCWTSDEMDIILKHAGTQPVKLELIRNKKNDNKINGE